MGFWPATGSVDMRRRGGGLIGVLTGHHWVDLVSLSNSRHIDSFLTPVLGGMGRRAP